MLTTQRRARRGSERRRIDVVGDRCGSRSLKTAAVLLEQLDLATREGNPGYMLEIG
jgi:hypothetical protein